VEAISGRSRDGKSLVLTTNWTKDSLKAMPEYKYERRQIEALAWQRRPASGFCQRKSESTLSSFRQAATPGKTILEANHARPLAALVVLGRCQRIATSVLRRRWRTKVTLMEAASPSKLRLRPMSRSYSTMSPWRAMSFR